MGFFEEISKAVRGCEDAETERLVLGWHASYVVAKDKRWGIGCVPNALREPHTAREAHTNRMLGGSLIHLAELLASPFPQEFSAATAACAALFPFPDREFQLDSVMPCARGDKVAVLGYERELIPLMREWGWRLAVFDDTRQGPDCFPQEDFGRGVEGADWVWLMPEAIRDRWLLSTKEVLSKKKGCFLQGPGLPYLPESFAALGVTHLVVPKVTGDVEAVRTRIAVGGNPWLCPDVEWRVHFTWKETKDR